MTVIETPLIESQNLKELKKFLKAAIEKTEVKYEHRKCFAQIDTSLTLSDIDNIESHYVGKLKKPSFSSQSVSKGFFGQREYFYDLLSMDYIVIIKLKNENESKQFKLTIENNALKELQKVNNDPNELDEETLKQVSHHSDSCTIV